MQKWKTNLISKRWLKKLKICLVIIKMAKK